MTITYLPCPLTFESRVKNPISVDMNFIVIAATMTYKSGTSLGNRE